jgi:O-succinylbenzoic acid--CoA ligase
VVRPGVEAIVELLATWRAGTVPAPLNDRLTVGERETASAALTEAELPEGTQVVLWTSGTSGQPRGVALSFENLRGITAASAERLELGSSDVWLASLSPAHVGGLVLMVRSILLGGTLVAPGSVDADRVATMLGEAGSGPTPTHISLVPTQLQRLLDAWGAGPAPAGLRCVLIGGAHAPATLVARATSGGWPIALTYGATEMTSQIATSPPALVREASSGVGRPMPGVDVRIHDSGEVLTRGPTRALGYVGSGSDSLGDDDGWYATGDLGRIDSDGTLHITGRRIDRIVSGGVTIDAVEVEEAVRLDPTVADICVVGIPDADWGERVGALVVPVEGEFDLDRTDEHLRGRLMSAKVPRLWRLASELPRNANGKVDRTAVRTLLSEPRSPRPS